MDFYALVLINAGSLVDTTSCYRVMGDERTMTFLLNRHRYHSERTALKENVKDLQSNLRTMRLAADSIALTIIVLNFVLPSYI